MRFAFVIAITFRHEVPQIPDGCGQFKRTDLEPTQFLNVFPWRSIHFPYHVFFNQKKILVDHVSLQFVTGHTFHRVTQSHVYHPKGSSCRLSQFAAKEVQVPLEPSMRLGDVRPQKVDLLTSPQTWFSDVFCSFLLLPFGRTTIYYLHWNWEPPRDLAFCSVESPLPLRYGIVVEVDPEGDSKVDFPRIEGRQWATWVNTVGWFGGDCWACLKARFGWIWMWFAPLIEGCFQSFVSHSGLVCALNGGRGFQLTLHVVP